MKTPDEIKKDAFALIRQTDASYRQLSKALCGKENATLEELLQAVDQVKQNEPGKKLICEITVDGEDIRKELELMEMDGKTIIERIEPEKGYKQLEQELAAVKRERDAAVADLDNNNQCYICAHVDCWDEEPCFSCLHGDPVNNFTSNFVWRGVCPENTEVQEDA